MTPKKWRDWADWMLNVRSGTAVTVFGYMEGTHTGTSEERALYAYFLAEFLETEEAE